jgi:hypothetical protein
MNSEIVRHRSPEEAALANIRKTQPEPASSPAVPIPLLQEAIASNRVTAEFRGNGASSGDSVTAQLAKGPKAGPEPLETSLPAGSVLVSDDTSVQKMMVVSLRGILRVANMYQPETRIVLTDNDAVVFVLAAYCMEFEKENPSHATSFTLGPPDRVLARIAQKGASLSVPAMQAAVWMQTDSITYDQMTQKLPISPEDWAAGQTVFRECRNAAEPNPVSVLPEALDEEMHSSAQSKREQPEASLAGESMEEIANVGRSSSTQAGPHIGSPIREDSLKKTPKLDEWRIVRSLAEQVCQRVTRRAIRALQKLENGLQSGDDSGLTNAWEEICVQVQGLESDLWDAFDLTVRQVVLVEVNQLKPHERAAVWLQTPAGENWDSEDEDSREGSPVAEDDIVEYLTNEFVYSAADDWSNRRIRKYLYQGWD